MHLVVNLEREIARVFVWLDHDRGDSDVAAVVVKSLAHTCAAERGATTNLMVFEQFIDALFAAYTPFVSDSAELIRMLVGRIERLTRPYAGRGAGEMSPFGAAFIQI